MSTDLNAMSLELVLPSAQPSQWSPPPSPRNLLSRPMVTKEFPLEEVHFSNNRFDETVRKLPTAIFQCQKVLGAGDGGTVYEVRSTLVEEAQALKVCDRNSDSYLSDTFTQGVRNEILLSKRLVHPHIIDFYATFEDDDHEYIITELCEHGSLRSFLNRVRLFNEPESRLLMLQLISAVHYLHGVGVAHNDLEAQNIMVSRSHTDQGLILKLADFGWSEIRVKADGGTGRVINGWSTRSDLELLPEILYDLLFRKPVLKHTNFADLGEWSPLLKTCLEKILSYRSQLYYQAPISSLLSDPWFCSDVCFIRKIPFDKDQDAREQPSYSHVGLTESRINRQKVMLELGLDIFFSSTSSPPNTSSCN